MVGRMKAHRVLKCARPVIFGGSKGEDVKWGNRRVNSWIGLAQYQILRSKPSNPLKSTDTLALTIIVAS